MTRDKLIQFLKYHYKSDDEILHIFWTAEDLKCREDELDIYLTPQERNKILRLIESEHSADIGVNWNTLDYYIDKIHKERKK